MQILRVLVIGALKGHSLLIKSALSQGNSRYAFLIDEVQEGDGPALKALCTNAYDAFLVFSDLPFPFDCTGYELIRKSVAGGCRSPVLILGSTDSSAAEDMAENCGAAGYLPIADIEKTPSLLRWAVCWTVRYYSAYLKLRVLADEMQDKLRDLWLKLVK